MSDREALVAAIGDAPGDDTPRLVFADWLDEHDQPERAEFVRLQCEAESLRPHDPRRADLLRRADELEFAHERAWLGVWADRLVRWEFRRGFLARARMTASSFREHGESFLRAEPVERLELVTDAGEWLTARGVREAVACPAFARVRGCTVVNGPGINPGEETPFGAWLRSLAGAPHVTRLRALELTNRMAFSRRPVEGSELDAFCAAPHLGTVTELDLSGTYLSDPDPTRFIDAIAGATFAGALTSLRLFGTSLARLAKATTLRNLQTLVAYERDVAQWRALFRSKALAKVTDFEVPCSVLADLADSPAAKRVRNLTVMSWDENFEGNKAEKAAVWAKAVAAIRPPEKLVLNGHNPGRQGFDAIRKAKWLRNAHTFEVHSDSQSSMFDDSSDLCPFFSGNQLPALTHLTVHEIADRELLAVLSAWFRIGELETLALTDDYYGRMWLSHFTPKVPLARLRTAEGVVFDCDEDVDRFLGLLNHSHLRRLYGGLIPQVRPVRSGRRDEVVELTGPGFVKLLHAPQLRHLEALALGFDTHPSEMTPVRSRVWRELGKPDVMPRLRDVHVGWGSDGPGRGSAIRKRFGPRLAI